LVAFNTFFLLALEATAFTDLGMIVFVFGRWRSLRWQASLSQPKAWCELNNLNGID
jgi:hypothetical protein